jgi:hypothetical protein
MEIDRVKSAADPVKRCKQSPNWRCLMKTQHFQFSNEWDPAWILGLTEGPKTGTYTSSNNKALLAAAYTKETQLAGIIYLHHISDPRMQGSTLKNLRMFKRLCGANNLNLVILATTHWTNAEGGSIPESVGEARTKELMETEDFWGVMVKRGSVVVRHDGSKRSAKQIVANLVERKVRVTLDIQRQLIDQKRNLDETDAGQALQSELMAGRKKFEQQLSETKKELEEAMQERDVE